MNFTSVTMNLDSSESYGILIPQLYLMQFYRNGWVIEIQKTVIVYHRWRNSIEEFLKNNAEVRDAFRTLSNICVVELLYENVTELLTIFAKKNSVIDIVIDRVVDTPLRQYTSFFEFRFSHISETYVYGYPQAYLGLYQTLYDKVFICFLITYWLLLVNQLILVINQL